LGEGVADAVVLVLEYPDASGKGDECRDSGQQSTFHTFSPDQRLRVSDCLGSTHVM
jgi:hypothetical protein